MQHQLERGVKKSERNNPEDTKASEGGGGGGVLSVGAEVPLQLVERPIVEQADIMQPMEYYGRADLHNEPSVEKVDLI